MARDRTTPMRALVGARRVVRRGHEHALARAIGDERDAEAVLRAAIERRDAAARAIETAGNAARALIAAGAGAAALARADAYAARLRRGLAAAEADVEGAQAAVAARGRAADGTRAVLKGAAADQQVAERALDRAATEARRVRENRED